VIRFKDGDRVKIIEVPEDESHYLRKTGVAKQPKGFGYENDDVILWFEGGGHGYFKEHQLEKA
jgi:hypothetical protein